MAAKRLFLIFCSQKGVRSVADIAEHICQIKWRFDGNFFLKRADEHFLFSGHINKGLMIWGSKCHQNNSPVLWDGYLKYEEAEVDRLGDILTKNALNALRFTLHCIALHCIALHCIASHCIAFYCIVFYCITLLCISSHYIVSHIALHCITVHCIAVYFIALLCIVLLCIVLHCTALQCITFTCITLCIM